MNSLPPTTSAAALLSYSRPHACLITNTSRVVRLSQPRSLCTDGMSLPNPTWLLHIHQTFQRLVNRLFLFLSQCVRACVYVSIYIYQSLLPFENAILSPSFSISLPSQRQWIIFLQKVWNCFIDYNDLILAHRMGYLRGDFETFEMKWNNS